MSKVRKRAGNPLGDLRAEADHAMLDKAFYETSDYLSLIESADKTIVVGRRGVGKSALVYQLSKYWNDVPKTRVIPISLDEDQVIGLNPIIELFGNKYRHIRAGCSLAWRYCLMMEIALQIAKYYKFDKADGSQVINQHLKSWRTSGNRTSSRMRNTLIKMLSSDGRPEERIGDLAHVLSLTKIEHAFGCVTNTLAFNCVLLIDKLDEGYEPTGVGVGFVDGIVDATIAINNKHPNVRPTLFLRDNMFRTIARWNPDFSRHIEGQVLRLHWSEYELMNMVSNRLRVAFDIDQEKTLKVWDRCASKELGGQRGFKTCLQLTLYRPRDILVLLNEAFYEASKDNREQIVLQDVSAGAKTISQYRLDDLHKEYSAIFPGLIYLTTAFSNRSPECDLTTAEAFLEPTLSSTTYPSDVEQEFAILSAPLDALRALYGVGFVGIRDDKSGVYVFCHDGKSPDREIAQDDNFLVHPCYWMALNLTRDALAPADAQDIHDEYDIAVKGESAEIREKKLNQLISQLGQIPLGEQYQQAFEEWCHKAVSTVFAGALRNIELCKPNGSQRHRWLVGLNLGRTDGWRRVYEDYQARNVVFAIENMQGLARQHYQQATHALLDPNGTIVFLVTRDKSAEMSNESDLKWVREIYEKTGIVVVKLPAKALANLLGKIRNPQKHDAVDRRVNSILDTYSRIYLRHAKKMVSSKKVKEGAPSERCEAVRVDVPSSVCYGELEIAKNGQLLLMLFRQKRGPGRRAEACPSINLGDQAFRILEVGIENARQAYISDKRETATGDGIPIDASECEPPAEYTYEISWSQNELASILHNMNHFSQLHKKQKRSIKTAMSRIRNLVKFSDDLGLVTEPDATNTRRTTIRFRYHKSG